MNTERRQEDKSAIFRLNYDNDDMYCSVLVDDKAIVSAFWVQKVYLYTV